MGKRKKRLTMTKYAKKYARKRAALFGTKLAEKPVAEEQSVDCALPEEVAPESAVNALKEITKKNRKRKSKPNTTNKTTTETKTKTVRRRRSTASS